MRTVRRLALLGTVVLLLSAFTSAGAGEWPQIGGPDRNYRTEAPQLSTTWPDDGPETLWRRPLGLGYSGIAVVGDRLYTHYREGEDEIVLAAGAETGETVWQHRYPAPFTENMRMEHGSGPHTTPLVVGDRLYTIGIRGRLLAFDRQSGEILWRRELVEEMGGTSLDRGYAASPLAYGDSLLLPVGGEGQGIVALDQKTGETLWSSQDFLSTYSSPILIEVEGEDQVVLLTQEEVVGVDPRDGRSLWRHPHPTQYGLNISVPLWSDGNLLFVSSAYNGGSRLLRLQLDGEKTEVEELWAHKQMRVHIGNVIRIGSHLYGPSGDFGPVPLTAVEIESGDVAWRDRTLARSFLLHADGKLLLLDEDGVLALATATPEGLEVHAKHQLFDERTWTPPTLVGRTLYARSTAEMVALELP